MYQGYGFTTEHNRGSEGRLGPLCRTFYTHNGLFMNIEVHIKELQVLGNIYGGENSYVSDLRVFL